MLVRSFESEAEGKQGDTNRRWDGWMGNEWQQPCRPGAGRRPVVEKAPYVVVAVASCRGSQQGAASSARGKRRKDGEEGFLESNHEIAFTDTAHAEAAFSGRNLDLGLL